jgi:hypothetical protein
MTANQTSTATEILNAHGAPVESCGCGGWTFVDEDGEITAQLTCRMGTTRTFAPGHDARLKGEFIRRGVQGEQVRLASGELISTVQAAGRFGFGHMVRDGIERRIAKLAERDVRRSPKAKSAEPVPTPSTERAKVGRWVYEGHEVEGWFYYTDKQGSSRSTDKFTRI